MWRQQHVVGHHAFTNLDAVDPDIRISDSDVRCVTPHHKWHPYQVRRRQPYTLDPSAP